MPSKSHQSVRRANGNLIFVFPVAHGTVLSPAKYTFLCKRRLSTVQRACHRSDVARAETCCDGVQDSLTSASTAAPLTRFEGRATRKRSPSHQSSSWMRESGVQKSSHYFRATKYAQRTKDLRVKHEVSVCLC